MKAFILVFSSIFFALTSRGQNNISSGPVDNVSVLTWNIRMLPGLQVRSRAKAIGDVLDSARYDVVIFQEAFQKKARKIIAHRLRMVYPYQAGPANRIRLSLKTNSGIWIISRHPVIRAEALRFTTRKGVDALARKGALLVELQIGDQPLQLIGTHLQNAGDKQLRFNQCAELYKRLLMPNQQIGVPQIIGGDFNISRYESMDDYRMLLSTLDASDGSLTGQHRFTYDRVGNDLKAEKGDEQDLIDYILVRDNSATIHHNERKVVVFRKKWHRMHTDLSDHYSVEAHIQIQSRYPRLVID